MTVATCLQFQQATLGLGCLGMWVVRLMLPAYAVCHVCMIGGRCQPASLGTCTYLFWFPLVDSGCLVDGRSILQVAKLLDPWGCCEGSCAGGLWCLQYLQLYCC